MGQSMTVEADHNKMEAAGLVRQEAARRAKSSESTAPVAIGDGPALELSTLASCSPDQGCPVIEGDGADDDGDRSPFDDVDLHGSSPEEPEAPVQALRSGIQGSHFSLGWDASRSPLASPVLSRKRQHGVLIPTHSSDSIQGGAGGAVRVNGGQQVWRNQALWTSLAVLAIVTMVVGAAVALAITTAKSNRRSLALMRALRHWYVAGSGNSTISPLEQGRIPPPASTDGSDAGNDSRDQYVLAFRR